MPSNPDTDTTYTLSGQFNDDGTEYIATLTPDDGTATTAVIPLMAAASSDADGRPGLVPKASAGDQAKFLKADGTWATPTNTNTYQRLYPSTNDVEYPITSRYNTTTGKSYYAEYGRYNVGVTLNPSKQTITAPGGFIGTADAAKEVPWSGVTGKLNATASEAGLIKVSSVNTTAVTVNAESTNAGRYYSVELNSDGKAIVNVPWSDTNTDTGATSVEVTGTGNAITAASYDSASRKLTLTKGATYNNYSLPKATSAVLGGVKVGDNITISDGTISLTKTNITAALGYTPPSTDTDTGATSITVSGTGNAVTSATYDASTRKITLTKGATYNNYSHPSGNAASKNSGLYKFSTDATSHINAVTAVTKADITALGIPGSDTNTAHAHTAGAGLTIEGSGGTSGTTTYSLTESGVTAGTYGPTANVSGTNNTTINIPQITVDEYGRVTSVTNRVYTSKNTDTNTTYTAGTGLTLDGTKFNHTNAITAKTTYEQSTAAPGYGGTFKIAEPKYDAQGHITGVQVSTITMPSAQTIPTSFTIAATATDDDVVILTGTNGSNKVTFDAKHAKKGPTSGYTSANSTTSISGYGDSKTIKIPQITVDAYGHVTAAADENVTITMPSAQTIPTQLKNPYALTIGDTVYDGSAAKTVTAKDLGLTGAMRFIGTSSVAITDGGTQAPTIGGSSITVANLQSGNVVLYGSQEFVWNGSNWELLGDEGSYKVKQTAVSDPTASGTSTTFIATISQNANGVISATKKTVTTASTSTAGLMTAAMVTKLNGIAANANNYSLPTASSTTLGGVKIGSNINISSGVISVPAASGTVAGVTIVYPADKCTTFTSDSGTVTPAAVKKAVDMFAITKAAGGTFLNDTDGQASQPSLKWKTVGENTPYIGFATDQTDGTFILASLKGTEYATGLAIGGGSGNLLWKGVRVATANDVPGVMVGATSSAAGTAGIVPAPAAGKQASFLRGDGSWVVPTDTKNTAGSTDSSSKLFLIGATSQAANPQTYSHNTAYVGTDGCLYSNSTKVSVAGHTHSVSVTTGTVKAVNSVGTMFTASVSGEVLVLTAGSAPTTTNTTVVTSVGTTTGGA